jgi:cytochrome c-type biogenesis protein CcmE
VNKRARMRLIGVTAIILIVIVAVVITMGNKQGAVYTNVASVTKDKSLVGQPVKVGGTVVAGSWDKQTNPMRFSIREEGAQNDNGPKLKVVYSGTVPSTFGDGVVAIVTGTLQQDGVVKANEMITKCPSKYESATGALPVADLVGKGQTMVGKPVRATGYVKAGSIQAVGQGDRFVVAATADGSDPTVGVVFSGALPAGMKDGSQVVIAGTLDANGKFDATSVAIGAGSK